MRQSIRALGWTVTISTLILVVFLGTAFFSLFQTVLMAEGIGFGEFQMDFTEDGLVVSVPIAVNNTGFYDISDFEIVTGLSDANGTTIVARTTVIDEIKRGDAESRTHNLTLSFMDILTNMTYLLFQDTEFNMTFSMGLRYAYTLGFQISMANMSMPWGAPLNGLEFTGTELPIFNGTHLLIEIGVEVENNSFLDASGVLRLEVYNETGGRVGSGMGLFYLPAGSNLFDPIQTLTEITTPADYTGEGYIQVSLEIPMIDQLIELGRVDYG
ncbi:MAG: hypothetical protein NWF14_02570 [Candidatus Bathyarchaeota archaeon]|nr:hypothetical protein [Candidatus Bathyarchaeota archaeon]